MDPAKSRELSAPDLKRRFDLSKLGIDAEAGFTPLIEIIGQHRAVAALQFGLGIEEKGFNIYVAGPPGIGKMTAVESFLKQHASEKSPPPDLCYVNHFDDPSQPRACRLPAGCGRKFQQDMKSLIDQFCSAIPRAFESEDYSGRREAVIKEFSDEKNQIIEKLNQQAAAQDMRIKNGKIGIMIIALKDGKVLTDDQVAQMSPADRKNLQQRQEALEADIKAGMKQLRQMQRKIQDKLQELDREIARMAVEDPIEDFKQLYQDFPDVVDYLNAVLKDVLENIGLFQSETQTEEEVETEEPEVPVPPATALSRHLRKYEVNVFVDNSRKTGAPVVIELNPSYGNLFGRIEKETRYGVLHTDFLMIQPGAVHRAHGGYLVIPAESLLTHPFSWQGLKRAIQSGRVQIEEPAELAGALVTKSLRPEPIPFDTKIILIGRHLLYYLLQEEDEEFTELFKVKADFDTSMPCTDENAGNVVAFVQSFCEKESLKRLNAGAMTRLLEYSLRLSGDREKLSTHFGAVADVIREANYWSGQETADRISKAHIQKAIDQQIYRSNQLQEHLREMTVRGTLLLDVAGEAIGQINGLSIISLGNYCFGTPNRITASVGPGRSGIVDIERAVELGGPIHSKGIHILEGFLTKTYAREFPLSLSARIVFEQSYQGIEGDSASSAELYALLSALARASIRQEIAVTGSVNQNGQIQAIGGVNEKIEGFFDICTAKGLQPGQGVLIPRSNMDHLMLRDDVVHAVQKGLFHVWAVETVDEALEILTGAVAGKPDPWGKFPENTLHQRIYSQLEQFARNVKGFR